MADLPLTLNYDGDLKRLLTYCRLHFINESTIEPYDIINHDLKVHLECDLDSVVCFCNLSNYLDRQEFRDLISEVTEINVPLLLVEFSEFSKQDYYNDSNFLFIDQDFVDWRL